MSFNEILESRLFNIVTTPSPLGNIVLLNIEESHSPTNISFVWDVGFQTNIESILFQKNLTVEICNIYNKLCGVNINVNEYEGHIEVPDESGTIIKPWSQMLQARIFPCKNHYKGILHIDIKFLKKESVNVFIDDSIQRFYEILNALHVLSAKL